jgi:hypothetical protein
MAAKKLSLVEELRAAEVDAQADTTADSVVDAIFNAPAVDPAVEVFDGIPIPDTTRTRASKYPWDTLNVGQSFFVPNAKIEGFSTNVSTRNKKGDKKYIVRKYTGANGVLGVMVWRKA